MLIRGGAIKSRRKLVRVGLHWVILCFETNLPSVKNHTHSLPKEGRSEVQENSSPGRYRVFFFFFFFEVFILVIQTHLLFFLLTWT